MEKIKEWCKNNPRAAAAVAMVAVVLIVVAANE